MHDRVLSEMSHASGHFPYYSRSTFAQIWEQCLIKRKYSSKVPFHTRRAIGSTIPPVQKATLETAFKLDEQEKYEPLYYANVRKLARKLLNGNVVWEMKIFRRTVLYSTWLGFAPCDKVMGSRKAESLWGKNPTQYGLL